MEDVKINEYVRTDNGFIAKIDSHTTISVIQANPQAFGNITKYSGNLIDLIEERRLCEWSWGFKYIYSE